MMNNVMPSTAPTTKKRTPRTTKGMCQSSRREQTVGTRKREKYHKAKAFLASYTGLSSNNK